MKLFKYLVILTFTFEAHLSIAQTSAEKDKELTDKYWIYRDRFRKRFVNIGGEKDGQSLPFLTIFEGYNTPIIPQSTLSDNTKIDASKLKSYNFISEIDAIGYEWKQYSFSTNSYIVLPHFNYIISIKEGFYYKLHFIDFYNDLGVKGYPKFEFQKI